MCARACACVCARSLMRIGFYISRDATWWWRWHVVVVVVFNTLSSLFGSHLIILRLLFNDGDDGGGWVNMRDSDNNYLTPQKLPVTCRKTILILYTRYHSSRKCNLFWLQSRVYDATLAGIFLITAQNGKEIKSQQLCCRLELSCHEEAYILFLGRPL